MTQRPVGLWKLHDRLLTPVPVTSLFTHQEPKDQGTQHHSCSDPMAYSEPGSAPDRLPVPALMAEPPRTCHLVPTSQPSSQLAMLPLALELWSPPLPTMSLLFAWRTCICPFAPSLASPPPGSFPGSPGTLQQHYLALAILRRVPA